MRRPARPENIALIRRLTRDLTPPEHGLRIPWRLSLWRGGRRCSTISRPISRFGRTMCGFRALSRSEANNASKRV